VKGKHGIRTENLEKKRVNATNRDVVVFAFFLLLSFLFWYLNSLGNINETCIRFPVKYIHMPNDRAIVKDPQVLMDIYLKGTGYSIFKLKLSGTRVPVIIDISKVAYKRVAGSKTSSYFILTSGLTKDLTVQLRSGCEITSIKPDTLFFTLVNGVSKAVMATPDNMALKSRKDSL